MKRFLTVMVLLCVLQYAKAEANITFADANVKAICVTNWDTNGDGELSEAEAAVVTSLGTVFKDNTEITSFEELRYFTGVTSIGNYAFQNCSGLTSISIPNGVTSFGNYTFEGCSNFTKVIVSDIAAWCNITFGNIYSNPLYYAHHLYGDESTEIKDLVIPEGVTSIGRDVFRGCSRLTSVRIPNSVTSIGYFAFDDCSSLTKVIVSDIASWCNITFRSDTSNPLYYAHHLYSDESTEITDLVIPESVTSIGNYAFTMCYGLTSITIGNSVTKIGILAFNNCRLASVSIPNSVTSIGSSAFFGCYGLKKVIVSDIAAWCNITFKDDHSNPLSYTNHLYSDESTEITDLVIPEGVTSIGNYAFKSCSGLTSVSIPNSVTSIGYDAFSWCTGLTSVSIPNSVTSIGDETFRRCTGLTSVSIPNSVTSIGNYAFEDCTGLTSVSIPNSVTSIGNGAFCGCSNLTSITVDLTTPITINFECFSNRANATLNVPYGCSAAYEAADYWKEFKEIVEMPAVVNITFADANVKELCVANWDTNDDGELSETEAAAVTSLGEVFRGNTQITSFDELQYFTGLTSINNSSFLYCTGLTSIEIPNSVTSIGNDAFYGCGGLTSVTIPNSVTSIGNNAFYGSGLTSITIPISVTSIGEEAFGCSALQKVIVSDIAAWCNITFENPLSTAYDIHLYSDENTEITDLVIPDGVTSIGNYAFFMCRGLISVSIPHSVTSIGKGAFEECRNLTSVSIPNSVSSIGNYAFKTCNGLTSIEIPNSVASIGNYAFSGCSGLTSVTIPNSVNSIGQRAFYQCSGMTSVSIPNSVTSIGSQAFQQCQNLTSVRVSMESPITIDYYCFSNCTNATLYVPVGSKAAYKAADNWKDFKEIVEFIEGDVNMDGETDVVDVVDIARFVVGTPAETFVKVLADINNDGGVNIGDAVTLVNNIAGDQNFSRTYGVPKGVTEGFDELTLTESSNSLSLCLANQRDYTAFQLDLYVPEGVDVTQMQINKERKQKHQLLYNKVEDGHWRVVALSTANNTFQGNDGELLNLTLNDVVSDVTVRDIIFFDTMGNSHPFSDISLGTTTKIDLATGNAQRKEESVYTLDGRRINGKPSKKGIYIINGKKFIMK